MMCTIQKSEFLHELYVSSAMVKGFARSGQTTIVRKIFESVDVKNVVLMHKLMVGMKRQQHGEEVVEVFVKMKDLVKLASNSYVIILSTLGELSRLEEGKRKGREVHTYDT